MTSSDATEAPATERWSALGGVLLSALYLWVIVWLLLAVLLPSLGLGWKPVVITSGSMEPLIRPGDVVLSAVAEDMEPGQVITYEDPARDNALTTHRILSLDDDGTIRTQGDANRTPDSTPVPADNVLGRGRLLVPMIGLPLVWLSGGAVLFGLWVVVTAISVAVVAGASGQGGPPAPPGGGATTRRAVRRLLPFLQSIRPRAVQQAVVRGLVTHVTRVHDVVYRSYRPNPSRLRRGAPGAALLALTVGLARTPAMVCLGALSLVLVILFDPDGPQFRIGRWERVAIRSVRAVTAVVPAALGGRGLLVVAMVVVVGASSVGRSAATFSAAADNSGSSFTAASAFPTDDLTLWLQNEPEGQNTASQTFLPLSTDAPTQATVPNYDTDRDADPGLLIKKGGADRDETDPNKVQRWTYTPTSDLAIASAQLVHHAGIKAFDVDKGGTITWFVRHCASDGTDCVDIAQSSFSGTDWHDSTSDFIERTTAFGNVSHVVPAGRQLELAVIVPSADDDVWFAYDTAAQPSRLELTVATPGVCPGAGSALQRVVADTRLDEGNPTDNYGGAAELDVSSSPGGNRRTLLTVALPTIPDGCTMSGATLRMTTRTSGTGRTFLAQRTDSAFDAATVTWATQPTTSGALGSGPSTNNGPTPIDVFGPVQELYSLGNTGIQLRDSVEDDNGNNRFHSTESKPYPDPEGPQLEVTWGP